MPGATEMSRGTNGRNPEFNPVFIPDVVNVTHRDDLSLIYKIIRIAVLWPLRPHLVSYKKRYPGGSQRLYQHPRRLHGITIKESKAEIPSTSSPSDYGTANPYAFSVPDGMYKNKLPLDPGCPCWKHRLVSDYMSHHHLRYNFLESKLLRSRTTC